MLFLDMQKCSTMEVEYKGTIVQSQEFPIAKSHYQGFGYYGEDEVEERSVHFQETIWIHAGTINYWSHPSCAKTVGDIEKDRRIYIWWSLTLKRPMTVSRHVLWRCSEAKGFSMVYIRMIKDMYKWSKTRVRTVGGDSEHLLVEIGLHQGSILSPFLFALVMDELTRSTPDEVPWCVLFADNIVLIMRHEIGLILGWRFGDKL